MMAFRHLVTLEAPSARRLAKELPTDREPLESQKDVLWDLGEDGTRVWKQPEEESVQLTANLSRVWQERGDFSQLTIDSIKTAPTKPTNIDPPTDPSTELPKKEQLRGAESISSQTLWDMKLQMAQHLGVIQGELTAGLDLLNIVLGPLAPETVDTKNLPIPSGGLAPAIHSADHIPPQPETTTLVHATVSLMRKQKTIKNVSEMMSQASAELGKEVQRSRERWNALLNLREGGWTMRPKGARVGVDVSLMGKGSERAAKEVGIAFATPEAAEALQVSSFASLEPPLSNLSGTRVPTVKFPPRPRRRLVVSLITPGGQSETFSPWSNYAFSSAASPIFTQDLEMARAEVFEEEIFSEVSKEAQLDNKYGVIASDTSVLVKDLGSQMRIKFEMVEKASSTRSSNNSPAMARLISSIMRLMMTSIYRSRRLHATGSSISKPKFSRPKILGPVLDLAMFYTCVNNLRRVLIRAATALLPSQLDAELECEPVLESADQMIQLLSSTGFGDGTEHSTAKIGGMWTLRIQENHCVFFTVACPAVISLWLPHQSVTICPSQLASMLEHEISECVRSVLSDVVQAKGFSVTPIAAGSKCLRGELEIFLTVSFSLDDGVKAKVEKIIPALRDRTSIVLSKYNGQGSVTQWINDLDNWT